VELTGGLRIITFTGRVRDFISERTLELEGNLESWHRAKRIFLGKKIGSFLWNEWAEAL